MNSEKILLRFYLESADRTPHTPTYERILQAARKQNMAGATILRGILGAGYHDGPSNPLALTEHVPIILEIVDEANRIVNFLTSIQQMMMGYIATLERAAVMMYRPRTQPILSPLELSSEVPVLSTVPEIQSGADMNVNENSVLLRIFMGESDQFEHKPLYEQIIQKVRDLGLAGATVLRGTAGFGANSVVHKASLLDMSSDLPMVIEIVDSQEKISLLLPHLQQMVQEGMITMEHVTVLMYRHNPEK